MRGPGWQQHGAVGRRDLEEASARGGSGAPLPGASTTCHAMPGPSRARLPPSMARQAGTTPWNETENPMCLRSEVRRGGASRMGGFEMLLERSRPGLLAPDLPMDGLMPPPPATEQSRCASTRSDVREGARRLGTPRLLGVHPETAMTAKRATALPSSGSVGGTRASRHAPRRAVSPTRFRSHEIHRRAVVVSGTHAPHRGAPATFSRRGSSARICATPPPGRPGRTCSLSGRRCAASASLPLPASTHHSETSRR